MLFINSLPRTLFQANLKLSEYSQKWFPMLIEFINRPEGINDTLEECQKCHVYESNPCKIVHVIPSLHNLKRVQG